jgi:hypothetical protein
MKCTVEIGSDGMIYIPSFIKTGAGVEGILRFCLSNLKGCNIVITDGRNLGSAPLKWAQVAYMYRVP